MSEQTPLERLFEIAALLVDDDYGRDDAPLEIRIEMGRRRSFYERDEKRTYVARVQRHGHESTRDAWNHGYVIAETPEQGIERLCAAAEEALRHRMKDHVERANELGKRVR